MILVKLHIKSVSAFCRYLGFRKVKVQKAVYGDVFVVTHKDQRCIPTTIECSGG
jgi:hypothetical protein